MDYQIVIHGKIDTKDVSVFKSGFEKLLLDTKSHFKGQVFVHEFDEYEIIDETEDSSDSNH